MWIAGVSIDRLGDEAEAQKVTIAVQIVGAVGLLGRKIIGAETTGASLVLRRPHPADHRHRHDAYQRS